MNIRNENENAFTKFERVEQCLKTSTVPLALTRKLINYCRRKKYFTLIINEKHKLYLASSIRQRESLFILLALLLRAGRRAFSRLGRC